MVTYTGGELYSQVTSSIIIVMVTEELGIFCKFVFVLGFGGKHFLTVFLCANNLDLTTF